MRDPISFSLVDFLFENIPICNRYDGKQLKSNRKVLQAEVLSVSLGRNIPLSMDSCSVFASSSSQVQPTNSIVSCTIESGLSHKQFIPEE